MRKVNLVVLIFVLALLSFIPTLRAQDVQSFNRASQYFLGDRDELLIKVNILGYVAKPGQYLVPRNTDLISLIAFAGGPIEGSKLTEVRIIRGTIVEDNGNGAQTNGHGKDRNFLQVDVKQFVETGKSALIPPLMAGDTVIIPQSFGNKFKNALGLSSFVGIIAAGASIALIINNFNR